MDLLNRLRSLLKLPLLVITILRTLYKDYTALLARAHTPPGIPVPNPTSAFWQDAPPHPELVNIHSPAGPPRAADIVIIGSGITGAAIARTVLRELARKGELAAPPPPPRTEKAAGATSTSSEKRRRWVRVLVLEARQLCSGATGRNGGHIKASPHELFHRLVHSGGVPPERAARLCAMQTSHVRLLGEVVRAERIEDVSEFREVQSIDFAVDEATDARMKAQMREYLPYQPPGYEMVAHSGDEARLLFGVTEHVAGAVEYPAGALWPYRFVTALWRKLLDQFRHDLTIETGIAVHAVETGQDPDYPYTLSTTKGPIQARHVVHATNGLASHLIPALQGKALGILCHMTAQRPGQDFPKNNGKQSWSIIYPHGFDYITQRSDLPSGDGGEILIGGGLFQSSKQGADMLGVYDDSKTDAMTLMHLEGALPSVFNWGAEAAGRRVIKAWSGVVGFSSDLLPLVGRLDPRITKRKVKTGGKAGVTHAGAAVQPGEWIAAYFCGDGMVWAWLCGTAVGLMLAGSEDEDLVKEPGRPAGRLASWFPPELEASWTRVQGMDIADLADEL